MKKPLIAILNGIWSLVFVATIIAWLLMLGLGIIHLHVFPSILAVGWWTTWPLAFIYVLIHNGVNYDNREKK